MFPSFKGKRVLILGLGLLGRGVNDAIFFAKKGAKVTVTDLKTKEQLASSIKRLAKFKNVKFVLGKHRESDIDSADLVLRNAGVPRHSHFLEYALAKNKWVEMDESLFATYCPCPIIGITGTRGKTTTTMLILELMKQTGKKVHLGGNILEVATLPLIDKVKADDLVVLELSSWQLQGFGWNKISPHVAVFTNMYPDHLNSYKSMDEYIEDKTLIFKNQQKNDFLVINQENAITKRVSKEAPSNVIYFTEKSLPRTWKLTMLGAHNRENAAAALQVADIFNIPRAISKKVITEFPGVEHRLEVLRTLRGVTYINDTTSTTPIAGEKALAALPKKPVVLIAGGATKNLDLTDFAKAIAARATAVILLEGTATDHLEEEIRRHGGARLIVGRFSNFKKAVLTAHTQAKKGSLVLLSPGCASFGMFTNEYDRGEQFKKIVKQLKP